VTPAPLGGGSRSAVSANEYLDFTNLKGELNNICNAHRHTQINPSDLDTFLVMLSMLAPMVDIEWNTTLLAHQTQK